MSSAVTPSDSACHPSDVCQSRYSSGRSQVGLPPPLPPLVRSEPRFRPRCPPLLVAPPQYTLNPRSAVGRDPRCPPVPGFPHFPQPACVAAAPRAFRISAASIPHAPNKPAKALAKVCSRHHTMLFVVFDLHVNEPIERSPPSPKPLSRSTLFSKEPTSHLQSLLPSRREESLPASWCTYQLAGRDSSRGAGVHTRYSSQLIGRNPSRQAGGGYPRIPANASGYPPADADADADVQFR
ncbi:hypothetical protein PGT21_001043 [Puccinia graminis f. sp. tritici]|uniref:Uncharacterized protein n=1 Tax=Puccinia graminis f. sp. tritici TaxID=56615 RepID=A0A5B0M4Y3_PUCGR|nr:hypothetical protein PGTUg99_004343 [Puccinia graminis f. sp. tritici]KAA1071249.1 hypothetical protein PGT21_001043 [Puccinia graminis f. sp. tritici]